MGNRLPKSPTLNLDIEAAVKTKSDFLWNWAFVTIEFLWLMLSAVAFVGGSILCLTTSLWFLPLAVAGLLGGTAYIASA